MRPRPPRDPAHANLPGARPELAGNGNLARNCSQARPADAFAGHKLASSDSPAAARELITAEAHFADRRIADALACYDRALVLGADFHAGLDNRWACLMLLGHFERAWQETDRTERERRRLALSQDDLPPHFRRVWNGTPLHGHRVRIHCYHGLGDTLQFIRYLPLVQRIARDCCVELQDALRPLLPFPHSFASDLDPADPFSRGRDIQPRRESTKGNGLQPLGRASKTDPTVEVELMELPYVLRTTLDTIPAQVPYVHVSPKVVASRRRELAALGCRDRSFNVGLVWSSGNWNRERDIPLQQLAPPLASVPGVKLFSLQRGPISREITRDHARVGIGEAHLQIVQTAREVADILATAAAICCMDLVISVDTMVAHLAGALGRPIWTLLPFHADWRWMADRSDSPWYPSMRLFRQTSPGDWNSAVSSLEPSLSELAAARSHRVAAAAEPPIHASPHQWVPPTGRDSDYRAFVPGKAARRWRAPSGKTRAARRTVV